MNAVGRAICLILLAGYLASVAPSFAADQPSTGPQAEAPEQSQSSSTKPKPKAAELEEVIVTGSRLNLAPSEATQQIQIFTEEDIRRSGQSTAADFLNTLPVTSLTVDPGSLQTVFAATGVRLRGLPLGTTLVLIDGRRVGISGAAAYDDIFDLTNIPLSAVDRIEILPQGSSAVYGSDAIAGVVNIILKKNFEGFAGAARYGAADDAHEVNANLAWGHHWEQGSVSVLATYRTQSELLGENRGPTANADYTAYGAGDARLTMGNPGNVFSVSGANLPGVGAPYAAVPHGFTGPPTQAEFAATAGQLNKLSVYSDFGLIPESKQGGLLVSGSYDVTSATELFAQLIYSHVTQEQDVGPAGFLYGTPEFQSYTVAASNPFNPFGETVGIGYVFPGSTVNAYSTDFVMPTLGMRGAFGAGWQWEIATWASLESERITISGQPGADLQTALDSSNPQTALNPFIDGAPGSPQLVNSVLYTDDEKYRSNAFFVSGLVRGSLAQLPAGPLKVALGAEFNHTTLHAEDVVLGGGGPLGYQSPTVGRKSYAAYAETHLPLFGPVFDNTQNLLDVTVAGRFDHFDDFGGKWTGEAGGALHPLRGLSLRGHWAQAFKAPSLYQLYATTTTAVIPIVDPITGLTTTPTISFGGNPHLQPITGHSYSFELVYSDAALPGLEAGLSNWSIHENKNIQELNPQTIVNNESDFPGTVVRAPSCASGPPCPIEAVNSTFVNFGAINVAGIDYLLRYHFSAAAIDWQPSISVTQTYRYTVALSPGATATNRVSQANTDLNWAPRWKGTLGVQARQGEWSTGVAARYVGHYQDYSPLLNGTYLTLGKVWYVDANARYGLERLSGAPSWLRHLGVELGAVNLFNRQPQFSDLHFGAFAYGFDYLQADMRGRFIYGQVDGRW